MNIFICQTPFQLYYSFRLIEFFRKQEENKKFTIIHSNLENLNEVEHICYVNSTPIGGFLKVYLAQRKIIKQIKSEIKKGDQEINFYFPHIGGLIANYLFYSAKKIKRKKKIEFNFYYEGILYFYDFKEKFQKFHLSRILISFLLGFRYRYNETILPYNSLEINKIFTPIKEFTKGNRNKIVEISFKVNNEKFIKTKNCLILGGPVTFIQTYYETCVNDILEEYKGTASIFFKGHASFNKHNIRYQNTFSNFMKKRELDYVELNLMTPIEELILTIKPFLIYSYFSSAVINLSLMYPNKYKIVCFIERGNEFQKIFLPILTHFKIKVVFV